MTLYSFRKPDGVSASVLAVDIVTAVSALQKMGWHFENADCVGETEKLAYVVSIDGPPVREIKPEMLSTP